MGVFSSIISRVSDSISKGGLFGALVGVAAGIGFGAAGFMAGGPAGALAGFIKGAKYGLIAGSAVGTIKVLKVPGFSNIIDWGAKMLNKAGPIRAANNWIRSGIEKAKMMGPKSDLEYLMAKLKNLIFQVLTVVVNALGKNNEKVVEQIKENDKKIKKEARGRKEEFTKGDKSYNMIKGTEQNRQKQAAVKTVNKPSKEKTASAREAVRAGTQKGTEKTAIAEAKRTGRLSQVPVKKQPVKDLSQVIGKTAAPVKPIVGKTAQAKDLSKVR